MGRSKGYLGFIPGLVVGVMGMTPGALASRHHQDPKLFFSKAGLQADGREPVDLTWASHLDERVSLAQLAERLSGYEKTSSAQVSDIQVRGRKMEGLKFQAQRGLEVIDIDALGIHQSQNIFLEGDGSSLLLIRIRGAEVNIRHKSFFVLGGLRPEQVIFYFPEAQKVRISQAEGSVDVFTGQQWELPGSIVAPHAVLELTSISIRGQIHVSGLREK